VFAVGADAGEGIERFRPLWLVDPLLYEFGIPERSVSKPSPVPRIVTSPKSSMRPRMD
jgi:hypothetical protein